MRTRVRTGRRKRRIFLWLPKTLPMEPECYYAEQTRWLEWATIEGEWRNYGKWGKGWVDLAWAEEALEK